MSQDPKILGLWKHKPGSRALGPLKTWARIQNLWSSENMSQDPKILGLWKHEPRSRTFGPLKTWVKTQKPLVLWKYEPRSKNPRPLKTWARIRRPPGKHISYSFKKKINCMNYVWTWSPTKRYVGNLPRDSVQILIHYMIICIFVYMHHTFTTAKYWLQS